MTRIRSRLAPAVLAVLLGGCGQVKRTAPEGGPSASAVPVGASASVMPGAAPSVAASAVVDPVDPDEAWLRRASLARLVPARGPGVRASVYTAQLQGSAGEAPRLGKAELATVEAPIAYRMAVAFYRLAHGLGARVVPVTVARTAALDEVGAALGKESALLRGLSVQNDGTVAMLLAAPASAATGSPWQDAPGAPFDPGADDQVAILDRWASSPAPAPGEDGALLRDYVEMRVLDYLAANVARRAAWRAGSALVLADNGSAFPAHVDRPTLDHLLRRLRAIARFPRGMREALARFDRGRAAATFTGGRYEDWLLTPRTVVELDERRAALLTLVEARIVERGAGAVLAL